jgi:L-amino acid N-acyltransferase YncA
MIRPCNITDAQAIAEIYNYYVEHTTVTFDEIPLTAEEMALRIENIMNRYPWLVYEQESHILGYAYASGWRDRSAYRFSVESTIYLEKGQEKKGIGTLLYGKLIQELKQRSVHCIIGVISIPNPSSIRLHEKLGFEKVAHMKQTGYKFNRWIDVGYWELLC